MRARPATRRQPRLELETLHEVARRAASLDVDGTLEAVVAGFERLTTADSTAIYLWSLENPEVLQLAAYRFDRRLYPPDYETKLQGRISARGYGLIGWVAEHRQPILVADIAGDPRAKPIPGIPLENKSAIVVPIIANEALLGVIRAIKMGIGSLTNDHFRLAQTLASQSALAVAAAQALREQAHRMAENEQLNEVIRVREARLASLIAASPVAIIEMDLDGNVRLWNEAAEGIFGWKASEVLGAPLQIVPVDREEESRLLVARVRAGAVIDDFETVHQRKDGVRIDVSVSAAAVRGGRPDVVGITLLIADITSRKLVERQLAHQALHDVLTDLPNRTLLNDRLEQTIRAARRDSAMAALLVIDLNDFKDVNDTFGHAAGDSLLRELGQRLRERLRETDTLARLGGDEFAVVLPGAQVHDALRIARTLRAAVQQPVIVDSHPVSLDASIGIAVYPTHGTDGETLLRRADTAMYTAKRASAGEALYAPEHDALSSGRLAAITDLRRAIDQDELCLHFQPIISLPGRSVEGAEALVRWRHPDRGLIAPANFIPLAERTGLIVPLTKWVVRSALREASQWCASKPLVVAVNLSTRNLLDPELPAFVREALREARLPAERLRLEVTEGTLMSDPDRCTATLMELRDIGVSIAIDDFGAGYSSLSYLNCLPVDTVKIDRSFVAGLVRDRGSAAIVRATVDLSHNFGFSVVAEGVEDTDTYEKLKSLSCDAVQGFLVSRPLPADAFQEWLRGADGARPHLQVVGE